MKSVASNDRTVLPATTEDILRPAEIRHFIVLGHESAAGLDGELVLMSIEDRPDGKKSPPGIYRFAVGSIETLVKFAQSLAVKAFTNVYIGNYVVAKGSKGRGGLKDVIAVLFWMVDRDGDTDQFGELPMPPSLVVRTSSIPHVSNQAQYWFQPNDRPSLEQLKTWGPCLRAACGADTGTGDNARMCRLPGTANHPNATKIARGRPRHPQASYIEQEFNGYVDFAPLCQNIEKLAATSKRIAPTPTKTTGEQRQAKKTKISSKSYTRLKRSHINGDRSRASYAAICCLIEDGLSDEQIEDQVLSHPQGAGERYASGENDLLAEIQRIRKKQAPNELKWHSVDISTGRPDSTFPNARIALKRLGGSGYQDTFAYRYQFSCPNFTTDYEDITDVLADRLRTHVLTIYNFDPFRGHIYDAMTSLCVEKQRNPVLEYLRSLVWDGQERLRYLFSVYFNSSDNEYTEILGLILMVAACRRVRIPGCKYDTMIVLEGTQGAGKSSALRILAGDEYFSDQPLLDGDARQQMEVTAGVWIQEASELQGMGAKRDAKIKAYLTRQKDIARAAYDRFPTERLRRFILVGSTNDAEYLTDSTGNRRYLPIGVGEKIDLSALIRDRDQLWAEAWAIENEGFSLVLPPHLWSYADAQQKQRLIKHPWFDELQEISKHTLLGPGGKTERILTQTIISKILKIPASQQTNQHAREIVGAMRAHGFKGPKGIKQPDGRVKRGYEREIDNAK